jgi:ABC-type branched-subunit amino acid transport system ATPase component
MSAPALQLHDVHKSFGRTSIINGVNLSISPGERHAIIGPNGAGKSTLFNLISGRFGVTSGRIDLHGESINGSSTVKAWRAAFRSRISFRACPCMKMSVAQCSGRRVTNIRSGTASMHLLRFASGPARS